MCPSTLNPSKACVVIGPAEFKRAGRRFASGVTVVTSRLGDVLHGATVSAFSTLSLEPMQVLISLGRDGRLAAILRESGVFAVSILAADQEAVSRAFATPARPESVGAFPDVSTRVAATGAPIVDNCLAFFDCTVASAVDSGDHTVFIGDVRAVDAIPGAPLIYFDGGYRGLALGGEQS
jgi:flavin reductase (DIM6/NTAB) family NADH-FMN oxidoreductase RutF